MRARISEALALCSSMAECLVARAHAYIKTSQFLLAKRDADRWVWLLKGTVSRDGFGF
jgi:hypothetical protein